MFKNFLKIVKAVNDPKLAESNKDLAKILISENTTRASTLLNNIKKSKNPLEVKDLTKSVSTDIQHKESNHLALKFAAYLIDKRQILKDRKSNSVFELDFNSEFIRKKNELNVKYSDENLAEFVLKKSETKYFTDKIKDSPFEYQKTIEEFARRLILFREALNNIDDPKSFEIIKESLEFFHTDNIFNSEDRGNQFHMLSEMYSDYYQINPNFEITAEKLASNLKSTHKNESRIILHPSLKIPSKDSYKHSHEIANAKKISSELGVEVFVTGDCDRNDPELLKFIGDLSVEETEVKQQNNVWVVKRIDIKMTALSQATNRVTSNENIDVLRSIGTVSIQQKININNELTQKVISNFEDKMENIKLKLSSVQSEEEKKIMLSRIEELKQEIIILRNFQNSKEQDLNELMQLRKVERILYNSYLQTEKSDENEHTITNIVD